MTIIMKSSFDLGWSIDIDPHNIGKQEQWFSRGSSQESRAAEVPGIIQAAFPEYHGVAWYWFDFELDRVPEATERCCLYFGAVDYYAEVWLNGRYLGNHEGGETPFQFDCTAELSLSSGNKLAVRVINPTNEAIDGFILRETPHYCKKIPYEVGCAYNHGGIVLPVELRYQPKAVITDVYAIPEYETGAVKLKISLDNFNSYAVKAKIHTAIGGDNSSHRAIESCTETEIVLLPGACDLHMEVSVKHPHLWGLDDPFLYTLTVTLVANVEQISCEIRHEYSTRCGFRDFRLDEAGFFQLNGKRIFVKSAHTANHFPIGQRVPYHRHFVTRDLLYAKAAGFNMVRFIAGMPYPEQLDFCDQIGLLVYEECYVAWYLEDSPQMAARYNRSIEQMVRSDRNHPSVVIWGLLNERAHGATFYQAVKTLPLLRKFDATRLVLLDSGRFDGDFSVGSASNPGTNTWQHVWGEDASDAAILPIDPDWFKPGTPGGYMIGAGDAHLYAHVPHDQNAISLIRTMGNEGKPVFLSEYGIGSLVDAIRVTRRFEQAGFREDLEDAALYRQMAEAFITDWKRLGMEGVYPFPEDMLEESQRLHAKWRAQGFDLIRSNPNIIGYNLTGLVDQVMAGEGLWTTWRDLKPGIMDALTDGWAPLRWCLFVTPMHVYKGRAFKFEAVLANEGVLGKGTYPICIKLFGPEGVLWEQAIEVNITDENHHSFAIPVLEANVTIDGEPGQYHFAAVMEKGGNPAGGKLKFHVSESEESINSAVSVVLLGIEKHVKEWLVSKGVQCRDYQQIGTGNEQAVKEIILVGDLNSSDFTEVDWQQLFTRIQQGAHVIFLKPTALFPAEGTASRLPFAEKGKCVRYINTLYHKEDVAKRHSIFKDLQSGGIMDWDYYGQIIPDYLFEEMKQPDEVIAAGFAVGYPCPNGYFSGISLAVYNYGKGKFTVNTLRILENIHLNPAADRLLLNLLL